MSYHGKRALDVLVAALTLILASPLLAIAALLIRIETHGHPIYRQRRIGRDGEPFELYKLRTMEDGDGPDEVRITPLGRFLRATSVDELPELWNVLKGDMSLVGPRPLLVSYLDRYTDEQARRHEVRPGLTGLAQVSGRNLTSWDERLALDVTYVDTWTIEGDVRIIARTVLVLLAGRGIHAEGQVSMPELPARGSTPA